MTGITLLIGTTNRAKGREMSEILTASLPALKTVTLSDLPPLPAIEETGDSFIENARLKAVGMMQSSGLPTIADDGGLVIDALNGAPGVHSHRFLGENTSFEEKMRHILELMKDVPDDQRTCHFECSVVVQFLNGESIECRGVCSGRIAHEIKGSNGFGYDPIFYLPEMKCHMAELTPAEKHRISHRGRAMQCVVSKLEQIVLEE